MKGLGDVVSNVYLRIYLSTGHFSKLQNLMSTILQLLSIAFVLHVVLLALVLVNILHVSILPLLSMALYFFLTFSEVA